MKISGNMGKYIRGYKMKEQITEEFARKLLNDCCHDISSLDEVTLKLWKDQGFIKRSREDEIREKINKLNINDFKNDTDKIFYFNQKCKFQKQLIEILDNKE